MPRTSRPSDALLLDTHIWLWEVLGTGELSVATRAMINDAASSGRLRLAAISIWEIALLASRGRIALGSPVISWIEQALQRSRIALQPLSPAIAVESCQLPEDFRSDPADTLIVATARVTGATLMTRDRRILAYAERHHLTAIRA